MDILLESTGPLLLATGDFETNGTPGNQNGSGYKCISLAFSTKGNLDI